MGILQPAPHFNTVIATSSPTIDRLPSFQSELDQRVYSPPDSSRSIGSYGDCKDLQIPKVRLFTTISCPLPLRRQRNRARTEGHEGREVRRSQKACLRSDDVLSVPRLTGPLAADLVQGLIPV